MTARLVAFVFCRLLAVYLVFSGLSAALLAFQFSQTPIELGWPSWVAPLIKCAVWIFAASGLWICAGWVSLRITRPVPETTQPVGIEDWQSLIVALVGGFFIMFAIRYGDEAFTLVLKSRQHRALSTFDHDDLSDANIRSMALCAVCNLAIGFSLIAFTRQTLTGLNGLKSWASRPVMRGDER